MMVVEAADTQTHIEENKQDGLVEDKVSENTISLDTPWQNMGLDSLDVVEVMIALEEEFHMEIPDAVADAAKTPVEVAEYIYNFMYPPERSMGATNPLDEPLHDSESSAGTNNH
jgi:acyl carrier protein